MRPPGEATFGAATAGLACEVPLEAGSTGGAASWETLKDAMASTLKLLEQADMVPLALKL